MSVEHQSGNLFQINDKRTAQYVLYAGNTTGEHSLLDLDHPEILRKDPIRGVKPGHVVLWQKAMIPRGELTPKQQKQLKRERNRQPIYGVIITNEGNHHNKNKHLPHHNLKRALEMLPTGITVALQANTGHSLQDGLEGADPIKVKSIFQKTPRHIVLYHPVPGPR